MNGEAKNIKKLTAKQEQFCHEFLIDFNATQAAIRAGYSEKSAYDIGSENLRKPEISQRLEELREGALRAKVASAQERMEVLTSILRGEIKERSVTKSNDGTEVEQIKETSANDRIKAIVELDKLEKAIALAHEEMEVEDLQPIAEMLKFKDDED